MEARGFNQVDLEQAAGLPRGYASRILSGKRRYLRPEQLQRLAEGLRVDYTWLATGEGEMEPAPPGAAPQRQQERVTELDPRYPNLAATIDWLRGQMPDDFLDDFAKTALKSDGDLSREDWYFAAKSAYARWRGKAVPPRPLPDDDDDPIAASMAAARKKHAKKKS